MKRILFTGGGTAGHVTPNLALMQRLQAEGWEIHYIGTEAGIEKQLVGNLPGVTFHAISAGKLRRYASVQNLLDPFRVLKGVAQSRKILRAVRPDVVFSKGGFVSVPVVVAAGRTPVVAHESDFTPGLANRIASRFADTVCVTFEDTLKRVPKKKGVFTGTPLRPDLYGGDRQKGLDFCGLSGQKPVLLVMGGSSGAQSMNDLVRRTLPLLLPTFDVAHQCGKGKTEPAFAQEGYKQFEFVGPELPDLLAAADVVLSRAGANAVFELLALGKPSVLIPLPLWASRGDQIQNATYFEKKGFAVMLDQDVTTDEALAAAIQGVYRDRERYIEAMHRDARIDGTDEVLAVIKKSAGCAL